MMTTRFIIGVPVAAAITFGLFVLMRDLVEFDEGVIPTDPTPTVVIIIGRTKTDTQTEEDENEAIEDEPPIDVPPPILRPSTEDKDDGEDIGIDWERDTPTEIVSSIEVCGQPRVRVNPTYPTRAASQGIEGYAVVGFVVTKEGKTRDVHVIEDEPPGVFGRAAVRAIKQWRYEPCVVNGEISEVRLSVQLVFELE